MKGGVITKKFTFKKNSHQLGVTEFTVLLLRRLKGLSMLRLLVLVVNGAVIEV